MAMPNATKPTPVVPAAAERSKNSAYWRPKDYPGCFNTRSHALMAKRLREILEARIGVKPAPASLARNLDLLHRIDRGLLRYNTCSKTELQKFIADRGLQMPPTRSTSIKALTDILEQADNHLVFDRLFDLPPELRITIYEFHFMSFGYSSRRHLHENDILGVPIIHKQAPLTRVSRQIREETLALFYSSCAFNISSVANSLNYNDEADTGLAINVSKVPRSVFKLMKNFRIKLWISSIWNSWLTLKLTLPLREGGCTATVTDSFADQWPDKFTGNIELNRDLEELAKSRVDAVLRLKSGQWERQDLEAIVVSLMEFYLPATKR